MRTERTTRWWVVRLELLIGVGATLLCGLGFVARPGSMFGVEPGIDIGPLQMPMSLFVPLVALATAVIGLIWMVRIFRGHIDEPPPWRYRGDWPASSGLISGAKRPPGGDGRMPITR